MVDDGTIFASVILAFIAGSLTARAHNALVRKRYSKGLAFSAGAIFSGVLWFYIR